jgi:hypothetical protein
MLGSFKSGHLVDRLVSSITLRSKALGGCIHHKLLNVMSSDLVDIEKSVEGCDNSLLGEL